MINYALRDCPFCSWPNQNDAIVAENGADYFVVVCPNCFAEGPPEGTAKEAHASWNGSSTKSIEGSK